MKPSLPNSPAKLALLALLGSAIASILFLVPWRRTHGSMTTHLLLALGILAVGCVINLKSISDLRNGIQNQRWPEYQINPLRALVESPVCAALTWTLIIAYPVFELIFTRFKGLGWVCFLFSQALSQLRFSVQRPFASKPSTVLAGWRNLAPIHSEHWGER